MFGRVMKCNHQDEDLLFSVADSWSYSWDTTKVPNGTHLINARAYDGEKYSYTYSIQVNVQNDLQRDIEGF